MGLPQLTITFQTKAQTITQRAENGIVALILKDTTLVGKDSFVYTNFDQVTDNWTDTNKKYIEMAFKGKPRKIYVYKIGSTTPILTDVLKNLNNRLWDYLAYPGAETGDITAISTWLKARRDTDKKTYKAVLSANAGDHEGIINFTTDDIVVDNVKYATNAFTARIAGILAGIGTMASSTYYQLEEVTSIKDLADDTARNAAIDGGELILINDGEKVKIARGVNSLVTTSTTKGPVFKKIRIVEIIDTIKDDITKTIVDNYIGKVLNIYDNRLILVGAINTYFSTLEKENVLDSNFNNICSTDTNAERKYLESLGIKTEDMDDATVSKQNMNDKVFLKANIKTVDAMEDITFNIYL